MTDSYSETYLYQIGIKLVTREPVKVTITSGRVGICVKKGQKSLHGRATLYPHSRLHMHVEMHLTALEEAWRLLPFWYTHVPLVRRQHCEVPDDLHIVLPLLDSPQRPIHYLYTHQTRLVTG